jgi:hypothetical protein
MLLVVVGAARVTLPAATLVAVGGWCISTSTCPTSCVLTWICLGWEYPEVLPVVVPAVVPAVVPVVVLE